MPSFLLLPLFFLLVSEKSSAVAEQQCRTRGVFLEPKEFTAETCATCYIYVHNDKFKSPIHKWGFAPRNGTQMPLQATKLTNGTHEVCFMHNKEHLSQVNWSYNFVEKITQQILKHNYVPGVSFSTKTWARNC